MEPLLPSGGLTALASSSGGAALLLLTPAGTDGAQALVRLAQGTTRIEVTVIAASPATTTSPATSGFPGVVTPNPATTSQSFSPAASPRGTVQVALGDGGTLDLRGWDGPPLAAGTRLTLQIQPQGDSVGLRLLAVNGRPLAPTSLAPTPLAPALAAAPPAPAAGPSP
ncbi:MAG: hypothetical protein RLZZ501_1598, partial [Pseudomonadota bacterium]